MAWDRPDEDTAGDKTEGVRIIGAEEAAEALERGDVAPRRADGEPRYGDRPAAPPEDVPPPAIRFPLPASESEELDRPRVASPPPMPHWTDPPTGQTPRIVPEGAEGSDEDLDAWSTFATSGPRWRNEAGDWEDADFDAADLGHDEGTRVGALDDRTRPAPDDFFGFTEDEAAALDDVPKRVAAPPVPRPRPRRPAHPPTGGRDMPTAVATGLGLLALTLVLFQVGPGAVVALVAVVVVLAAAELFGALQRGGYQPATLLGLVACAGLVLGAYWRGEAALPVVLMLTVVGSLLWYLVGVTRNSPLMNAGVTVLAVLQVGLLGSFGALILQLPDGLGILFGVIFATAANDVGALLVGQQVGRAPVAPEVSPNKTVEGVVGGAVVSVILTTVVVGIVLDVAPWTTSRAALLALCIAVAAPLGDLCESMVKRDLGIKDMGSLLPGHGGFYDRFDGLLFALPTAYYLCRLLDIG
jgi:phosphatidate cytidylyltransferase